MPRERLVNDMAAARAAEIVDAVRHLLRPEEQREFFNVAREAILAGCLWVDVNAQREAERLRPLPN